MIRINAFVEVIKIKDRDTVLQLAKEMVKQTVKEDGCIAYDVFESSFRPEVLIICETWADEATLEAHLKSDHFVKLIPEMQEIAKLKIEKFTF